jgi:hypothetical protein
MATRLKASNFYNCKREMRAEQFELNFIMTDRRIITMRRKLVGSRIKEFDFTSGIVDK